jgi:hypothetical protein
MEKLGWRDRRISPDSGSLFQSFPTARLESTILLTFNFGSDCFYAVII